MLFAVTPWRPFSAAMERVNPAAPALDAAYAAPFASPVLPASDTIVMTRPQRRSTIAGSTARVQYSAPYRLTRRYGSQAEGSDSAKGPRPPKPSAPALPALLTRMSTPSAAATPV